MRARLTGATRPNAIVVPQRAVQQGAKGHFVWVINKQNLAELRPVVVGDWYRGDGWIVSEGLAGGDQIVVDGGVRLAQGAAVTAKPCGADAAGSRPRRRRCRSPPYPAARRSCPRRGDIRAGPAALDADAVKRGAPAPRRR